MREVEEASPASVEILRACAFVAPDNVPEELIIEGASELGPESIPSLLFLIDELERSLHPRALGELVRQLRELAERAGVQILATSHSPYLLDWLKPEEVRLTGFLEDGSSTIRELADHPEFDRWKDEMTPGEIWSTVGEEWIK